LGVGCKDIYSSMKKTLLLIAVLSAASFTFAGGDKTCTDKTKCDAKCEKACCKDCKSCKDCKACCADKAACENKADCKKDAPPAPAPAKK
jgi:hypothetical protein